MKPDPDIVSDAAKRFLQEAEPLQPWNLEEIDALRTEEHEAAAQSNADIIGAHIEDLTRSDIGGIPALTVTPRNYDSSNDDRRVLYFFGGAFVMGSPDVDLPIIAGLATRLGVKVIAPWYRRAPEHPCPAAIDDGFAVYRALLEFISPDRLAVAGESAGGNLSLAVTLRAREQGLGIPAATALMSPWCDVTPTGETQQQPAGYDPTLDYELHLKAPAAAYAGHYAQTDPQVSPLYAHYTPGFPSTLITTGTRELFRSDCERLTARMREAGIDVQLRVWQDMWHAFEWYTHIPEAQQSMDEIANFIRDRLNTA